MIAGNSQSIMRNGTPYHMSLSNPPFCKIGSGLSLSFIPKPSLFLEHKAKLDG
jgi:hypothetical protein